MLLITLSAIADQTSRAVDDTSSWAASDDQLLLASDGGSWRSQSAPISDGASAQACLTAAALPDPGLRSPPDLCSIRYDAACNR